LCSKVSLFFLSSFPYSTFKLLFHCFPIGILSLSLFLFFS
jgi:hypothetical protein